MRPDDDRPSPDQSDPLAGLPDAVYRLDCDGRFTYVNPAAAALLEQSEEQLLGNDVRDCFPSTRGSTLEQGYLEVCEDGRPRQLEFFYEPQERWYDVRVVREAAGLMVFFRDITDRQRDLRERESDLRELTAVLDSLPAATVLLGADGAILSTNQAWVADGEVLRRNGIRPGGVGDDYLAAMSRNLSPEDHATLADGLRRLLGDPRAGTFDFEYPTRLGTSALWFRLQAARVGDSQRLVVSHIDVTERVRAEQALAWQAAHDELTGLPNRSRLLELMGEALRRPGRERIALLHLDLDGFKTINDSLGQEIGDELLRLVGARLAEQVRPGDVVGRLGGDQFVVLARDCDSNEAAALAFRLQTSFGLPFVASGVSVPLSASIGIAMAREDVREAHQLLGDADAAMMAAKTSGRDRVHLFSPALREAARWRLEVATRLRKDAIDQLVVHYQPVVNLRTGAVEGMEALVRWQHPERGLLPPDAFLSVAEETGQVIPITRWLLRETTRRAAEWAAQGLPLRLSVNVSARHFAAETLVRDVRTALRGSGFPADQLMLKLTETSVAEDPTRAEEQLSLLRSFGVGVAIDDFGTGWSSLAQLFSLPIGTLKIDRSLIVVAEKAAVGQTGAVLAAIVGLTRTLGIRSVAEGVETVDHLHMVRAAGCDLAQGWLLGQPMPAEEVATFVRRVAAAGGDLCALAVAGAAASQAG